MSDDRQRQNERFEQALDDMFGPAPSEPDPVVEPPPEPAPEVKPVPARPTSSPAVAVPYSAPVKPKRSRSRMIAFGCGGAFGLVFLCLAVLLVIGLVVGEDEGASAVNEPLNGFAPTAEPSYTAGTGGGTLDDPILIGMYAELSPDWRVAIVDVSPDATDLVMAENQFNDPPEDGRQFFMAMVSVENMGDEPAAFPAGVLFRALNGTGHEYTTFDDFCGVVPDGFPYEEVLAGDAVSGNVCWSVMQEDAASLVMRSITYLGGYQQLHFSLQQ